MAELKGITDEQRQINARKGAAQRRFLEEQMAEKAAAKVKESVASFGVRVALK